MVGQSQTLTFKLADAFGNNLLEDFQDALRKSLLREFDEAFATDLIKVSSQENRKQLPKKATILEDESLYQLEFTSLTPGTVLVESPLLSSENAIQIEFEVNLL